jgi:hypothetical protein
MSRHSTRCGDFDLPVGPVALGPASTEHSLRAPRQPVKAVKLLMPVWGHRYVNQFAEFCLPTLLAPHNIPSVAELIPCQFVLMSSAEDASAISTRPAWRELGRFCETEIRLIDDLIADGNHSATITLSFARAIRETGRTMLDTCFILLTSDYLFANGSLKTVIERIRAGASGVLAGNYQIVAEDAIPHLRAQTNRGSTAITLQPRDLVQWSFQHLHPATLANVVNCGFTHNSHVNRLFWRVDGNTLIGRFYLLHLIAVRPEVKDFVVGSSFDYSFVPEMCPSKNLVTISDSDEYFVVEMQPRDHESKNLLPGPIGVRELADSLSEWATADHRRNVDCTIVYHAGALPNVLPRFVAEADALVASVRDLLTKWPHPYRHHHYWLGSIAIHRAQTRDRLARRDLEFILGEASPPVTIISLLSRWRTAIFGVAPDLTRLHPRWPDYGLALAALRRMLAGGRLLLVANQQSNYSRWLTGDTKELETLDCEHLLKLPSDFYPLRLGKFDSCLMVLTQSQVRHCDELVDRTGPLLASRGRVMILVTNDRSLSDGAEFCQSLAQSASRLADHCAGPIEIHFVPATRMRRAVYRAMQRVIRRGATSSWRSPLHLALLVCGAIPLAVASYFSNLATVAVAAPPASGFCSSAFFIFRPLKCSCDDGPECRT